MKRINLILYVVCMFIFTMFLLGDVSAYSRSSPSYSAYNNAGGLGGFASFTQQNFDEELCSSGIDFLLQLQPFECEPAVVRSDLLEENDVTVFCKIGATQINPLIDVEAINTMNIIGEYPREIKSVTYFPAQSALGYSDFDDVLTSPVLSNLGYVAITLRQNSNESSMPDFVSGNLTAKINYDVTNAFGVGNAEFYLPVLNDDEFSDRAVQYSFWEGRGYLRAESVSNDEATISIYSDVSVGSSSNKQRVTQVRLEDGETSDEIYLSGFSPCLATMKIRLNDLEDPDTRAELLINADYAEVTEDSIFLDGKCTVTSLKKDGLNQKASIRCKEDEKTSSFNLFIYPKININVNGVSKAYSVGDYLYKASDGRSVYLSYIGSKGDSTSVEDLYAVLVSLPVEKTKLDDGEISSLAIQMNYLFSDVQETGAEVFDVSANLIRKFSGGFITGVKWTINGQQIQKIDFKSTSISPEYSFQGGRISLLGFSEGEDNGIVSVINDEYTLEKTTLVISLEEIYKVKKDGSDTGFYLTKSQSGSPRLVLRDNSLLSSTVAEFYGKDCDIHQECAEYVLSKADLKSSGNLFENMLSGTIYINENKLVLKKISFEVDSTELYRDYYDKAISDFETVINSFGNLYDDSSESYGEKALYESILLSEKLGQRKIMKQLCEDFLSSSPDSVKPVSMCSDDYTFSNSEVSSRDVVVNGKVKTISFGGVKEPTYEEYGTEVLIRGSNGKVQSYQLRKGRIVYLNGMKEGISDSEYIRLDSIDEASVKITVYVAGEGTLSKSFITNSYTFNLDETKTMGGGYTLTLNDINIEKNAKVSVIPSFNYQSSESEFGFKIGIEKRTIQLSDEQIKNRVDSLNNSITDLEKASNKLNSFNEITGKACIATGAVLTAKNFLENSDGKSIARQKVMRNAGGWNDFCESEVSKGSYISLDDCFLENSEKIDSQVDEVFETIQVKNEIIKTIEANSLQGGTLTNNVVNQTKFMLAYSVEGIKSLDGLGSTLSDPEGRREAIDIGDVKTLLSYDGWDSGIYDVDELKDIELYATLLKTSTDAESREFYNKTLYSLLYNVNNNAGNFVSRTSFFDEYGIGEDQGGVVSINNKLKTISVSNLKTWGEIKSKYSGGVSVTIPANSILFPGTNQDYFIKDNELVYPLLNQDDNRVYLLVVSNNYVVSRTFELNKLSNQLVMITDNVNPLGLTFKKYDEGSYKNPYKNPEVRYYEEEPYTGYPAIVPLDTKNGWYAATKPKLPVGSQISAYDASGRLNSFWLCNVGQNGLEEFSSSSFGDDICQQINVGIPGQVYNQFAGLSESETTKLVNNAVDSIEKAQRAYKNGVNSVRIDGQSYRVGEPAVEVPAVQCQDFMSPKECNLLFNVCDPVVCPSSRCDFGGAYPVKDVVQSGIIGSIALCAPNYKEGIKVPVCTTGVQAGLDSWISVQKSYRDCLQENLDSGETIGICDEIHSVYACEFFWRQSIPLAKVAVPKLIGFISGQNSRGGGEYLGLQSAWDNAKDSLDYFKQYYASESYNAFKVRSVDEAGGEVCKSFVSTIYPSSAELLNSLTTPRSPPQFTGSFDEIPFTTVTNPPTSQYKVYYHIYAGQDSGAYYRVYLKGGSGSYYQDSTLTRIAGSGYVSVGDYASDTVDFTAPSGYTELCIVVNNQEECGFGKVSTSFAVNYVNDLYLAEQSTTTVKTEEECRSGTASLYSLLNPNFQDVAEGLIDPALYQKGITRVCATNSPGLGTDAADSTDDARWRKVGYCGDTNVGCWLDTDSVKNAIKSLDVESSVLNDTAQSYLDELVKSGSYISNQNYSESLKEINKETDSSKKIELINKILDKVFFSNQKAELYLIRGLAYGDLSVLEFGKLEKIKTDIVDIGTIVDGEEPCDSSKLGEKIVSVANSKIGEDTTRLYEGEEVYDNVCSTFVSNVLIDAGLLPQFTSCSLETTPYRDSIRYDLIPLMEKNNFEKVPESQWKEDLVPGDIIIWGCNGLSFCSDKPDADQYQHITVFEKYESNGIRIIHDGGRGTEANGAGRDVESKIYTDPFGASWYIAHVYRASCSSVVKTPTTPTETPTSFKTQFIGYSSPDFEFQDGSALYRNIHYVFYKTQWYWLNYKDSRWYAVSDSLDNKDIALNSNKQMITSLRGKDYVDGLEILVNGMVTLDSGADLVSDNAEMDDEGTFTVELSGDEVYYFRFNNQNWEFNPIQAGVSNRNEYWSPVSKVSFNKAINQILYSGEVKISGQIPSEEVQDLILSLVGRTYPEGAALIFDLSSKRSSDPSSGVIVNPVEVQENDNANQASLNQINKAWADKNLNGLDLSRFSERQISVLYSAPNCAYCDNYQAECDANLCAVIGTKFGTSCQFSTQVSTVVTDDEEFIKDQLLNHCSAGQEFTDRELQSIYEATQCGNCGGNNICGKAECLAIGEKLGKNCVYSFLNCKENGTW